MGRVNGPISSVTALRSLCSLQFLYLFENVFGKQRMGDMINTALFLLIFGMFNPTAVSCSLFCQHCILTSDSEWDSDLPETNAPARGIRLLFYRQGNMKGEEVEG